MAMKAHQKIVYFLFSVFLILALTSCGSDNIISQPSDHQGTLSHNGADLNVDFPAPRFLALNSSIIGSLVVEATIDDGDPHPLTVHPETHEISGTITGVPSGDHTLHITYFVSIPSGEVVVCTYKTQVGVGPGQATTVSIQDTDLDRNIDDDHDGFTNLAEVRVGTDPLSEYNFPQGESPYVTCGNGTTEAVSSAHFQLTAVLGPAIAGTAEGSNYKITVFSVRHK